MLKNAPNFICERLALLPSSHFLPSVRVYPIAVPCFPPSSPATQPPSSPAKKPILPSTLFAQYSLNGSVLHNNGPSPDHDFPPPDLSLQQQLPTKKRNSIAKSNFLHPRRLERWSLGNDRTDSRSASGSSSIEIRLETITFPRSALPDGFFLPSFRLDLDDGPSVEMRLGGLLLSSECESE